MPLEAQRPDRTGLSNTRQNATKKKKATAKLLRNSGKLQWFKAMRLEWLEGEDSITGENTGS
jgi:hypothetical protein